MIGGCAVRLSRILLLLAFAVAAPAMAFGLPGLQAAQAPTATPTGGLGAPAAGTRRGRAAGRKAAAPPARPKRPATRPAGIANPALQATDQRSAGPTLQLPGAPGSSLPWSIIILLTGITLVPSILLCITPFARLLIVFHFLRQALGLQTTPSNQMLIGLSLILTGFLMQPVATQIYTEAVIPYQAGRVTAMGALGIAEGPMRVFMSHYVRQKDAALFTSLAKEPQPASLSDLSMRVLVPAYILSELKAGFEIGTILFLPFLIIDMVVASITTSVGMLQLPPVVISTPLKLLLFLMVDGWHLLIGSLMRSFS